MKVRSGPWQGEPVGEDNCNIVRCCGKEVLAKAMARGTRTALGLDVWTSLPVKAKSYTCPEDIRVYAAGVWRRSIHLPREICICDMMSMLSGNGQQMHIQKSAEVIVAAWDAAAKDRTECEVLHLESLEEYLLQKSQSDYFTDRFLFGKGDRIARHTCEVVTSQEMMAGSHSFPERSRTLLQHSQCMTETRTSCCWKRLCFLTSHHLSSVTRHQVCLFLTI